LTAASLQGPDVLLEWKYTGRVSHENGGRAEVETADSNAVVTMDMVLTFTEFLQL
jgi:hypothetical protein